MRRAVSISFTSLAVAIMLAMSVVPHHHHGAAICMAAHECEGGECSGHNHETNHDRGAHEGSPNGHDCEGHRQTDDFESEERRHDPDHHSHHSHHSHHHRGAEHSESAGCIAETEYVERYEREEHGGNCNSSVCGHGWHLHVFPLLCLYADLVFENPRHDSSSYREENIIYYESADALSVGGLRAPPASLC